MVNLTEEFLLLLPLIAFPWKILLFMNKKKCFKKTQTEEEEDEAII